MDPDSMILKLVILALLIACNAFFAMSEIAIVTFNDNKLRKLSEDGDKRARRLLRLVEEPSRFLSTIQVGVTLSGFLASASAAEDFSDQLGQWLNSWSGLPMQTADSIALVLITILLSYVTLIFGELVPKRIAMHNPEKISFLVGPAVSFVYKVCKPFVMLISASTNLVLRLIGIDPKDKPEQVTEEEIRMMVDVGNEEGTIELSEKEMIDNVFEFDDTTAEEVMTHRTEMVAVENTATIQDVVKVALDEGYSRIPVYEEDIDNIVGIIYVKDMLRFIGNPGAETGSIQPFIRKVLFVPESNRCTELFRTFKEKKIQIAVVVDEYGGTSGIVTMEDLLESIVGNMQDEYDNEEEEYSRISDNVFTLDGAMSIYEAEKVLGQTLDEEEEYDTVSGLLTDVLDRIPGPDEKPVVQVGNVEFTVLQVEDRRIAKVKAEIKPQPKEEDEDEE